MSKLLMKKLEEEEREMEEVEGFTEAQFMDTLMEEVRNKTLNIIGDFDEDLVRYVRAFADHLYYFEEDTQRPLFINLSSHGGKADALFAILDILNQLKEDWGCTLIGNVSGYASSCAAILWSWCDERYMGDFAEVLYHEISYGFSGFTMEHEAELKRTKKMQKKVNKIICEKTPLTENQLKKWYKNGDTILDKDDCLKFGLLTMEEDNNKED